MGTPEQATKKENLPNNKIIAAQKNSTHYFFIADVWPRTLSQRRTAKGLRVDWLSYDRRADSAGNN